MSLLTEYEFSKCVNRFKGDWHVIKSYCRDQLLVMSYAHSIDRSGLRGIETTLDLFTQDLYRSELNPNLHLISNSIGYILIKKR